MRIGKIALMGGVAALAMAAAAGAQAAGAGDLGGADKPLVLAQNVSPSNGNLSNAELASRLQAVEDQLAAQQERAQSDRTRLSTLEQSYNSAVWSFDNGRPSFASGDGRFTFNVRMRFQSDFVDFDQDPASSRPSGFNGVNDLSTGAVMRRAYLGFDGKVYNDFAYDVRFNVGGSNGGVSGGSPPAGEGDPLLNRIYLSYIGIPNWHFSVGVLEPVFAGELTTSSSALPFMERPEIDNIASDSFGAGDPRRAIEIGWSKTDTFWAGDNLAITGSFTGARSSTPAGHGPGGDEQSQILGRISDRLWSDGLSNFQLGFNYSRVLYSGNSAGGGVQALNLQDRPQARVDGTRLISTGNIAAKTADMWSVDVMTNLQNFYFQGEYSRFNLDRQCGTLTGGACAGGNSQTVADHPSFFGWYLEGTWILSWATGTTDLDRDSKRSPPLPRVVAVPKYSTRVTRPQLEGRHDGAAFVPHTSPFRWRRDGVCLRGCRVARRTGQPVERAPGRAAHSWQQAR